MITIPQAEWARAVAMIPEGQIATESDVLAYLKRRFLIPDDREVRINWERIAHYYRLRQGRVEVDYTDDGDGWQPVPTWRVVNSFGYITKQSVADYSLRQEGHELEPCGQGGLNLRPKDWKKKRFRFPENTNQR